ncbi:MAG: phage terminase small subunit P27 family [Clostridium sp.]|nr:phage terminase small subunit P27 family [Clostridium sp.]
MKNVKPVESVKSKMSKEDRENRKKAEAKLYGDSSKLKAPSWLNADAKKEFKRIVTEMKAIETFENLLSNLDLSMLAIYCNAYANYIELSKLIENEGMVIMYTNKAGETNPTISAYVQAQQKYIDVIFKCSSKLGLSVSDRLKLIVPSMEDLQENKFSKFIK